MRRSVTEAKRKFSVPRWVDKVFLVIGFLLLAYVVSRYPIDDLGEAVGKLGIGVVLSPCAAMLWITCNTCAIHQLLDKRVPWPRLLQIKMTSDGYNALLPLAGMGGEPYRLKHISTFVPFDETLTMIIRDRVTENAMGLAFTATGIAVGLGRYAIDDASIRASMVIYIAVGLTISLAAVLLMVTSLPGRASAWLAKRFGTSSQGAVRLPPGRFVHVLFWYLCARLAGVLEVAILMWLLGFGIDPPRDMFIYSVLQAAGFIAFPVPAGVGVFESAAAWVFDVLALPGPSGIAFALARRGRMLAIGLLGVGLHVVSMRRARKARS